MRGKSIEEIGWGTPAIGSSLVIEADRRIWGSSFRVWSR